MVPFSFPQTLLKSRVMKKHSSTFEVWTPGVWRLKSGAFALSCLLAFLILIPSPVFDLCSMPSHLGDPACLIRLSTETSQLSTAIKVNQASDSSQNPSKFEKIKVNQGKSNLFFYLAHGGVHGVDHRPSRWWPVTRTRPGFKAVLKGFKVI
jgi:hypothetical protein